MSNYIFPRGKAGTYYARLRVPKDVQPAIGRREKSQSLGTTDRKLAEKLARKLISEWEDEFDQARQPADLREGDFEALARSYYAARLGEDVAERRYLPSHSEQENLTEAARQSAQKAILAHLAKHPEAAEDTNQLGLMALDKQLVPDLGHFASESREVRLNELRSHLPRRNYSLIMHEVDALIKSQGLQIGTGSPEHLAMCDTIMRAEIDLLERQLERDRGIYGAAPTDPMLKDGQPRFDNTSFEQIIDERERRSLKRLGGTTSPATIRKYRRIAKEFAEWRSSTRAASVTRKEVECWRDELIDSGLSTKTIIDKISCVKSILSWGQKQSDGMLFANGLPLASLELPSKEVIDSASKTYTKEQAACILLAARLQKKAFLRWVPWLAAYSGARVNELLQLEKQDVFEHDGAWFYQIRHEGERTTKTKKGRTVPIHPAIVEEGFIDFVSSINEGRIFQDTRMDGNIRDWIRKEVLPDLPSPRPSPMHGFRHLFEDLRIGTIESDAAKYITGRAISGSSSGYGKSKAMFPELARQMARFPRFL